LKHHRSRLLVLRIISRILGMRIIAVLRTAHLNAPRMWIFALRINKLWRILVNNVVRNGKSGIIGRQPTYVVIST